MARVFTITEGLENMGAMKTGGQGSVYKGRRIGEIFTAIKILPTPIHSESADDKNFIAFQNEVHKLKKVNEETNPNVVKIISSGITDSGNLPFIEMEFIEGPDLEELIKPPHDPVFTIKEVLKVAEQLSSALAHCHKQNVRHGDIKSNNVKFNKHTGNYVLLDFGLAIMSDEQRRSSMRHAGAIEFIAPEQNEGQMLFETDVYSFGVVLFELLAGTVPFPLKDKGETARNLVMIAHMESLPPDLISLRRDALPESWDDQKKQLEMQVSQWLVSLVYKCLQKKPSSRFANGMELHNFIAYNSISTDSISGTEHLAFLQQEIAKLRSEKEQLQQQLSKLRPVNLITEPSNFVTEAKPSQPPTYPAYTPPRKESNVLGIVLALILTAGVIAAVYYFIKKDSKVNPTPATVTKTDSSGERRVIGEYIVTAPKAYFHNEPDESTRRNAYAIASSEIIKATDEKDGFIYTELTNSRGQVSKGWLNKEDMITLAEWSARNLNSKPPGDVLSEEEISIRLNEARVLMNSNKVQAAVDIYKQLTDKNVSEAAYEYANLALQNKNNMISCNDAFNLLLRLSNNGYIPAKRTLGFLYSFADDDPALLQNSYDRCNFIKDLGKGTKLLMEAILTGDSTARRFLDDLNAKSQQAGSTDNQQ
jgi:serine/threonine protein kinase